MATVKDEQNSNLPCTEDPSVAVHSGISTLSILPNQEDCQAEAADSPHSNKDRQDTRVYVLGDGCCNSPNFCVTTKEHQEYWKSVKCKCQPVKLLFQIPSTRIEENQGSKYVMYKIVVIRSASYDNPETFIERRYSAFEKLHKNLLTEFEEELEDVIFPKKNLTGNFTTETIQGRQAAFECYLEALYSVKCVRHSVQFIDFFVMPKLKEAYSCLRGGKYDKALETFLQVVSLQEKVTQHSPALMVPSYSAILICHKGLDDIKSAYEYGEKALILLHYRTRHKYYIPLLETMVNLAYELKKEIVPLQEKLANRKAAERFHRSIPTLKELIVQEYIE
nr:PREDICTED: sorting nexin-20 [Latimeria chalumnae]|eukprot:XP_006002349.1 PREDICTED: sorting nexin-20 [Latimeria chalumnae]